MNRIDLRTKGYELAIRWNDRINLNGKRLNYEFFASLGDAKSKITKFDNPNELLTNHYAGKEWGEIWGLRVDGFFSSDTEAAAWDVDQSLFANNVNNASGNWAGLKGGDIKFVDIDKNKKITRGQNTLNDRSNYNI